MLKRTFEAGVTAPQSVGIDYRPNPYQQGMFNLIGPQGFQQNPFESDFQQWSSTPISITSQPASTPGPLGNPSVQLMGSTIEFKTIAISQEAEAAVLLGPNGVAPLSATTSSAFVMTRTIVNSHMPSQVPVRGRVRMGTFERTQRSGRLSSYGVGLEMPMREYVGLGGPLMLRLAVEQNARGIVDFFILLVYNMMQNAFDFGLSAYIENMKKANVRVPLRFHEWLQRDTLFLGAMQRLDHPFETLMNYVREQLRLASVTNQPDIVLANHRLGAFIHNIRAYTEFFRAGPSGPAVVEADGGAVLAQKLGIYVHTVRASVVDDEGEFDFMTNTVRYGEFVPMLQLYTPSDTRKYRTEWRNVWILDRRSDSWRCVTLAEALFYSGRWDPATGKLRSIDDFTGNDGTPATSDPFSVQTVDGRLRPIDYFGEMPHLDFNELRRFVDTGSNALVIPAEMAVLRTFAQECRNAPHNAEVEKLLNSDSITFDGNGVLTVENKAERFALNGKVPYFGTAGALAAISAANANSKLLARCGYADGTDATIKAAYDAVVAAFDNGTRTPAQIQTLINVSIGAVYPAVYFYRGDPATGAGQGLASAARIASPIAIGDALRISNEVRADIEARLLGAWAPQSGSFQLDTATSGATLVAHGLLRQIGGALDMASSDRNACSALALVHNYGYTNASDAEGVHATEHMRGLMLTGLQHVSTEGSAADVSTRVGAYLSWLNDQRVIPENLSRPLATPATADQAMAFSTALTTLAKSEAGKNIFGANAATKIGSAMRKIGAAASNLRPSDIGSRLGTAFIGAYPRDTPSGESPSRYVRTALQYTAAQINGYYRIARNDGVAPTRIKLENPAAPGNTVAIADLAPITSDEPLRTNAEAELQYGSLVAKRLLALDRHYAPVNVSAVADLLLSPTDMASVQKMLVNDKPIPIVPLLLRWRGILRTAGMIATRRGSQRSFYAFPLFSMTYDDSHQVMRAQTKFEAGAFITGEKDTYHMRNVLITGCEQTGLNVDFATPEGLRMEMSNPMMQTGSIVVVLEPPMSENGVPALISAYGSWEKAGVTTSIGDINEQHFHSSDWLRKFWGLTPPSASLNSFQDIVSSNELLAMWRGSVRYFDPNTGTAGEVHHGTGPIASHWFNEPGMFTAWDMGTAYPAHSTTKVLAS